MGLMFVNKEGIVGENDLTKPVLKLEANDRPKDVLNSSAADFKDDIFAPNDPCKLRTGLIKQATGYDLRTPRTNAQVVWFELEDIKIGQASCRERVST